MSFGAAVNMFKKADDEGEMIAFSIFIALLASMFWPFIWSVWAYKKIERWLAS